MDSEFYLIVDTLEITTLKKKLTSLENSLVEIKAEISESQKKIKEFFLMHNKLLGKLTLKILELEMKIFKLGEKAYEEAESDYENYQQYLFENESNVRIELSAGEEKELRSLFREALFKCHPDRCSPELKDMANEWVVSIKRTFDENDLKSMRSIVDRLKGEKLFKLKSEFVSDVELLESKVKVKELEVAEERRILESVINSEDFQTIKGIRNFKKHFSELKRELTGNLKDLKAEYAQMLSGKRKSH